MKIPTFRFEIYKDKAGEYRARFVLRSEVIFSTKGYSDRQSVLNAVEDIKKHAADAEVAVEVLAGTHPITAGNEADRRSKQKPSGMERNAG